MIEVLKQMQEALRKYHYYTIDAGLPNQSMLNKGYAAYQAGKQAIAELESQESNPIKDGWKLSVANGHSGYGVYAHMDDYPEEGAFLLLPIKELESQEPVAHQKWCASLTQLLLSMPPQPAPCNCQPPQRTWVGLTDEEKHKTWYEMQNIMGWYSFQEIANAIEAKLKERNI